MDMVLLYAISAVVAYLVGGVNPAIVLSKLVYHEDIRTLGSGNPGFTNFKRVYGGKVAWLVFLLDISKGVVLCSVFGPLFARFGGSFAEFAFGASYVGFFAMLGHCYPVWYGFKGGKGFLVAAATIWFMDWHAGLVALCIMMLLLFTVKYMSLSVICAAVSCPITLAIVGISYPVMVCCILSVFLMIWRHKENIVRLARGTERKFSLFGHKKTAEAEQRSDS